MSALDLNFVRGKRIGWNGTLDRGQRSAKAALAAAGAILVERPVISPGRHPGGSVLNYEAHRDIDHYYAPPRAGRADQVARSRRTPTTWPTSRRR